MGAGNLPELVADLDDKLIGRTIGGKFALRQAIGSGASGTVYKADQLALGRTVAVKILRAELSNDERFVKRFHVEALAASRLNHPNTVSIIDYGQTNDGLLYLVMEYLRGPTLSELLRESTPSAARVADLISQVLAGLEEAHDAGVVHADLKSDNVVVERRRADWDLVKVVDFGIAQLVGHPTAPTEQRTIAGTPDYMAPEVILGAAPTFASDIYAVGVMLYELLTGTTPFGGGPLVETLRRHVTDSPMPPGERRPDLAMHPVLAQCALRAMAKEPSERFGDATEFKNAVAQVALQPDQAIATMVDCGMCGGRAPASFRFCPECGARRDDGGKPILIGPEDTASYERAITAEVRVAVLELPLVERDDALARLTDFLSGHGADNTLQVVGRRTSGRTQLVRAAIDRVEGLLFLAERDPGDVARPFHPVRSLVARAFGLRGHESAHELAAALEAGGVSPRDQPAIAELLGSEGPLWQLEPSVRRREILTSVSRVLLALGERGLILVFEDVDRYDTPSQEIVRYLVEAARGRGSLRILLTTVPDQAGSWPDWVERLDVAPLSRVGIAEIARAVRESGVDAPLPDAVEIDAVCDGNPAHVEHLMRYIAEGGAASTAPSSLADLVATRLDHLPHESKLLCQAVAVFGLEARLDRVFALTDEDPVRLRHALSILIARRLMTETQDGRAAAFRLSLVRDVVYDSMPAHVRRDMHTRAARLLIDCGAEKGQLGHHHELAGELEAAVPMLSQAGDEALHELDDEGARLMYQRALGAARRIMLDDDDATKRAQFVTVAIKLAESLREAGALGLARGLLDEVEGHCHGSRVLQAQVLRASAHLHGGQGNVDGALLALREAIGLAIITGQRDLLCELYLDVATTQLREGLTANATAELEEGIDVITLGEGAVTGRGPAGLWRLLYRLAQLYALDRKRTRAVHIGEHALRHAQRASARVGGARIQTMMAGLLDELGESARAADLRQKAVEAMRRLGDRRATAELLLDSARPTSSYLPIAPASLREAQELAEEIGWSEGVERIAQVVASAG